MGESISKLRARIERQLDGVVGADVIDTVLFCFDRGCSTAQGAGRQAGLKIAIDRLVKHRGECGGVDINCELIALHEHLFEDRADQNDGSIPGDQKDGGS